MGADVRARCSDARRATPSRSRGILAMVLLAAVGVAWGCTEDALTGPVPEGEEGVAETVEVTLSPGEMDSWRDTTFTGFADPSDAPFLLLADRTELRARSLFRFGALPDSISLDDDTVAVESFPAGEIRVTLDTVASTRPDQNALTLRLLELTRPFEADEATWTQAADGNPWSAPGGDFGRELGRLEVPQLADTLFADTLAVPITTDTEAVLEQWRSQDGRPGAALVVEGAGSRLQVTGAFLQVQAKPADRDTTVTVAVPAPAGGEARTFIYDPPPPGPGLALRLGGLPASRSYLSFEPPRNVGELQLPRATINRAELVFFPAPLPEEPFRPNVTVTATGIRLGTDPFRTGPKTPIGNTLGTAPLSPDSTTATNPIRIGVTSLVSAWASNPDSAGRLQAGLRLVPDGQILGFWEFGSAESPQELRPFLRLVVTPPSEFEVP